MSASATRKGERTRLAILEQAAAAATTEGLEPLSIGRLAELTGMSKSGLIAHFGSKADLQLATIRHAAAVFQAEVMDPAHEAAQGIARVEALLESWLGYCEREIFPGGCFFASTTAEFAGRPGPVKDRLARTVGTLRDELEDAIREAQRQGTLSSSEHPDRLTFELQAFVLTANWAFQLYKDPVVFAHARAAIKQRLELALP